MSALLLRGVSKTHRSPRGERVIALQDIDLEVGSGELVVVVGPSGAGKTTLLRLMAGLDTPEAGEVRLAGRSPADVDPRERGVAIVYQEHPLFPHLTVVENLAFGLRQGRPARAEGEIRERLGEVVELLGLGGLLERRPEGLSGGERQRVALGTALVRRPAVLLLDEPLAQLDAPARLQLRADVRRVQQALKQSVVLVTHEQSDAMALGDRLAVLDRGRWQQVGPPLEVYRKPANAFVARFLGMPPMNLIPGRLASHPGGAVFLVGKALGWALPGGSKVPRVDGASGEELLLGVRPGDLRLQELAGLVVEGQGRFAIEAVEHLGAECLLRLRAGSIGLLASQRGDVEWRAGTELGVGLEPGSIHWFEAGTGRRLDA